MNLPTWSFYLAGGAAVARQPASARVRLAAAPPRPPSGPGWSRPAVLAPRRAATRYFTFYT